MKLQENFMVQCYILQVHNIAANELHCQRSLKRTQQPSEGNCLKTKKHGQEKKETPRQCIE